MGAFVESLSWGQKAALGLGLFAGTSILSVAAVTVVLVRLPATYFRHDYVSPLAGRHPFVGWVWLILKNILGALLILFGVLLSLPGVPGQGLLTVLIGLMLVDFPGRRRLERRLVSRPSVLTAINAVRARFGQATLQVNSGARRGPEREDACTGLQPIESSRPDRRTRPKRSR